MPQAEIQDRQRQDRWIEHGRVPGLDGLRAVSILLVLLEHSSLSRGFPWQTGVWLGDIGHIGVSMFFTISGFLITLLLVREWNRSGTVSMKGFYIRRALRILPAYLAFLAAVFVVTRLSGGMPSGRDWTAVLTYTMNFVMDPAWPLGHMWSLSVEEQFYVVWPLLVLLLAPRRAIWVILAYLLAAPVARLVIWAFFTSHLSSWVDESTPLRLDSIAAGCLLALLAHQPAWRRMFVPGPRLASRLAIAAAAVLATSYVTGIYLTAYLLTLRYSIEAVAMTTIIWCVANMPTGTIGRILQTRPFATIGVLSYSLYLWQQLFLGPYPEHWIRTWPLNLVFAGLAAALSYYVIESPFLRLKDKKAAEARQPAAAPQPAAAGAGIVQEV